MNIKQLIKKCGGDIEVSYAFKIHPNAVGFWKKRGIPFQYWDKLMQMGGVKLQDIYNANKKTREGR